jgi:hypothetical protein
VRSRRTDLYALLGVAPNASTAEIKRAYELALNRANRDGAIKHSVDLVQAYETLSDPRRREVYDRHGVTPIRERSPAAPPPPTPWRIAQRSESVLPKAARPKPAKPKMARPARGGRRWQMPAMVIFGIGVLVGLILAVALRNDGAEQPSQTFVPPIAKHRSLVTCVIRGGGPGYAYVADRGQPITCKNGAIPHVTESSR